MLLSKNSIPVILNTCMWFAILYMNVPSIHTSDFLGFGFIEQAEGIPSNSCRTGFCHIQCSCHGNCCICCISPSFENIYIYRTYINILYLKYFFSCHIKNMHPIWNANNYCFNIEIMSVCEILCCVHEIKSHAGKILCHAHDKIYCMS